jgi:hypothetical protein
LRGVGWLDGGDATIRKLAVALSRPGSGPFGPHLGLGGLGLGFPVMSSAIDEAARAAGGLDDGALTPTWPWDLHEPLGLDQASRGLVCSYKCV